MKRMPPAFSIMVFMVLFLSCTPGATPPPTPPPAPNVAVLTPEWQRQWDETLSAAKKEGQVLVYTNADSNIRTALTRAVKEKYGTEVSWVAGSPIEVARKVIEEKRAGMHLADAFIAGGATMLTVLKPEGLLAPLEPLLVLPEVRDGKVWQGGQVPFHDKDGTGIAFIASYLRYVLVNTEQVKKDEITSYQDLLKDRFKGQIVLQDPTVTGTGLSWVSGLVRVWGLEPTRDYLKQLARQEPVITRDTRQQVEWVSRGKYPVALAPIQTIAADFINMGAPLTFAPLREKSKLAPANGIIAAIANPGHPAATRVFVNWILSREGQAVTYRAYGMPSARSDVPPEGILPLFLAGPGEDFFLQDEEDYLMQEKMRPVNRQIFASLLK